MSAFRKFVGWGPVAVLLLTVTVLAFARYGRQKAWVPEDEQAGYDHGDWREREKLRKEILAQIPGNPEILVNITHDLMPGTPELTALGRKGTQALVRGLLDNASDDVRSVCAGVLAQVRDPESASALVEALGDRNEVVRHMALLGLGNLADPSFGRHFAARIEDPEENYYIKSVAVDALGKVGWVQGIPLLLKLVKDQDQSFAWVALNALWHMRNKADRDDLVDIFMHVLKEDKGSGGAVVDYLGELKADEAAAALAKYHVGRDPFMKNRIILAMGKIGSSKARGFLKDVMKNTQTARHLNNAAIALAGQGERKEVIRILLSLLADRKAYMRINAAFALGEIGAVEPEAVEGLVRALEDRNDYVRSEAAVALGRIGEGGKAAAAAPMLEQLAAGDNPFVALDAVIALNRIDHGRYRQLIFDKLLVHMEESAKKPHLRRIVERGIRFLAEQKDAAALPFLLAQVRSPDVSAARTALELLQQYPREQLAQFEPSLLYLTHTCSFDCFTQVLRSLREWKMAEFTPALLERVYRLFYDGDKSAAYFTLGKIAPKEAAERIRAVNERSHTARLYQQFALANLGDAAAVQHLVDIVRDGTLEDKRDAAFLLAALDSAEVVPKLAELMDKGDPFTAVSAAAALVGHGHGPALDYLYSTMKQGTPIVADEAERVLLVSPSEEVEEYLARTVPKEKDIVTKRRAEEILYQRAPKEFR